MQSLIEDTVALLASPEPARVTDALGVLREMTERGEICAQTLRTHAALGAAVNRVRRANVSPEATESATSLLVSWKDMLAGKVVAPGRAADPLPPCASPSAKDAPLTLVTESVTEQPLEKDQPGEKEQLDETAHSRKKESPEQKECVDTESAEDSAEKPIHSTHAKRGLEEINGEDAKRSREDVDALFAHLADVRMRAAKMLATALAVDSASIDAHAAETAVALEDALFAHFSTPQTPAKEAPPAYRAALRSRYLNLKDREHGRHLRRMLLAGRLEPTRFAAMAPADMASAERQAADREMQERNLREARAAQDNEAETDQFRCGRCAQRRTKYYQLQTRSADEPMTTFVTCINCGHRWKFC